MCVTDRVEIPYIFALFAGRDDPRDFWQPCSTRILGPISKRHFVWTIFVRSAACRSARDRRVVIVDGEAQFSPNAFDAEKFGYFLVLHRKRQSSPTGQFQDTRPEQRSNDSPPIGNNPVATAAGSRDERRVAEIGMGVTTCVFREARAEWRAFGVLSIINAPARTWSLEEISAHANGAVQRLSTMGN